jgi:peptidoglycan/LPS O-acetylase OafA/YrhL
MKYRREVDGLRALAVVPVMFFHAGFEVVSGGYVGVDVFFVISGYLITTILITEMEEDNYSILRFYERRARRILPALTAVIAVSIPVALMLLPPKELADFSDSVIAAAIFASNILFWREAGYFDAAAELKPLLHTWSLAVEEQYYILFPLFLFFIWRFGRKAVLGSLVFFFVASLALGHWAAVDKPSAAFYLLPTRGWELLIGALSAFYLKSPAADRYKRLHQPLSLIGLLMIVYAIFVFDDNIRIPGLPMLIPTAGAALIILFATEGTIARRILGAAPFVGIGLISYSAYLWHQPILVFARYYMFRDTLGLGLPLHDNLAINSVLLVVSLLAAWASWSFVELPFRQRSKMGKSYKWAYASVTALGAIALAGFLSIPAPTQNKVAMSRTWAQDVRLNACLLSDMQATRHAPGCYDDRQDVLVWGDSHAASVSIGLREAVADKGLGFTQLTETACPPLLDIPTPVQRKNCNRVNDIVFDHISGADYGTIVLAGAWFHEHYPMPESNLASLLDATIRKVKAASPGSKIVIVGAVPRWQHGVANRDVAREMTGQRGNLYFAKAFTLGPTNALIRAVAEKNDVTFVDPSAILCGGDIAADDCLLALADSSDGPTHFAYVDYGHLSVFGSEFLSDKMVPDLEF